MLVRHWLYPDFPITYTWTAIEALRLLSIAIRRIIIVTIILLSSRRSSLSQPKGQAQPDRIFCLHTSLKTIDLGQNRTPKQFKIFFTQGSRYKKKSWSGTLRQDRTTETLFRHQSHLILCRIARLSVYLIMFTAQPFTKFEHFGSKWHIIPAKKAWIWQLDCFRYWGTYLTYTLLDFNCYMVRTKYLTALILFAPVYFSFRQRYSLRVGNI